MDRQGLSPDKSDASSAFEESVVDGAGIDGGCGFEKSDCGKEANGIKLQHVGHVLRISNRTSDWGETSGLVFVECVLPQALYTGHST
jgi:hypothetical protein